MYIVGLYDVRCSPKHIHRPPHTPKSSSALKSDLTISFLTINIIVRQYPYRTQLMVLAFE
jgi:hypothetical protein